MIYVATEKKEGLITAYFAKSKKYLKEMGFKWIANFNDEQKAIVWVNENYSMNIKEFLYG